MNIPCKCFRGWLVADAPYSDTQEQDTLAEVGVKCIRGRNLIVLRPPHN
jgi:hypothetical protein